MKNALRSSRNSASEEICAKFAALTFKPARKRIRLTYMYMYARWRGKVGHLHKCILIEARIKQGFRCHVIGWYDSKSKKSTQFTQSTNRLTISFLVIGAQILVMSLIMEYYIARRGSRKLWTLYETVSCIQQLCEHHTLRTSLLFCVCFVMTPAPSIRWCTVAHYLRFHSHAQVLISYWHDKVNRSIWVLPLVRKTST